MTIINLQQESAAKHTGIINTREIQRAFSLLASPGQVVEIRILNGSRQVGSRYTETLTGYFDDSRKLIQELPQIKSAMGIYLTLQPCMPDLLSRAANRLVKADKNATTPDKYISKYNWLLIDCDPERVAGISSTDSEHDLALEHSSFVRNELSALGWPDPIRADSGNGSHLLYKIDLAVTDVDLVKRTLEGLAQQFSIPEIHIDQTVFNPSRLCKLYGTLACKGDNTASRPHRMSRLLDVPDDIIPVTREQLEAIATVIPIEQPREQPAQKKTNASGSKEAFTADDFIQKHHIGVKSSDPYNGGTRYLLEQCVWDPDHKDNSACIFQFKDGRLGASCSHDSCNGKGWKEFRVIFEPDAYAKSTEHKEKVSNAAGLPDIVVVGKQYRDSGKEAVTAMHEGERDNPRTFVKAGELVRVARDEVGNPIRQALGIPEIRNALTKTANYFRTKKVPGEDSLELVHTSPPKELAEFILAMDPSDWQFPPLTSIVEMPVVRPDGSILDTPGYDPVTHLYYVANKSMKKCKVPHAPTKQQMLQAVELINQCIGEFPYELQADYANMFALLITLVTRYMYDGDVMTAVIDATKQGTGKSLLAIFACILASGRPPAMTNFPAKEEETKKVIDSKVMAGVHTIVFDNVKRRFQSASLDMLSTCHGWYSVRPLGQTKDIPVYTQTTVIVTGNNIQMDSDQARRCFQVRLVSPVSNPDERTDITIKNLPDYAIEHRAELVAALLTIVRAWYVAGKPQAPNKLEASTYGKWAGTVGSILTYAGIEGFQENRNRLKAEANTDEQQITDFLHTWNNRYKDYVPAVTILEHILTDVNIENKVETGELSHFLDTLPDDLRLKLFERERKKQSMIQIFTKWLAERLKTPYGPENLRIENTVDKVKRQKLWGVNTGGTGGTGGQNHSYASGKNEQQNNSYARAHEEPTDKKQEAYGKQQDLPPVPPVPPVDASDGDEEYEEGEI
jgi:hypothetical protein